MCVCDFICALLAPITTPYFNRRPPAGSYAKNPANGQEVPIWVADYVLGGYGR